MFLLACKFRETFCCCMVVLGFICCVNEIFALEYETDSLCRNVSNYQSALPVLQFFDFLTCVTGCCFCTLTWNYCTRNRILVVKYLTKYIQSYSKLRYITSTKCNCKQKLDNFPLSDMSMFYRVTGWSNFITFLFRRRTTDINIQYRACTTPSVPRLKCLLALMQVWLN